MQLPSRLRVQHKMSAPDQPWSRPPASPPVSALPSRGHPGSPASPGELSSADLESVRQAFQQLSRDEVAPGESAPQRIVVVADEAGTRSAAVHALAAELQRPVEYVDLGAVHQSHVGQTEQALEQIFARAEASATILVFDEADALFGQEPPPESDSPHPDDRALLPLLRHQLENYRGTVVLGTRTKPSADQLAAGAIGPVIDLSEGIPFRPPVEARERPPTQRRDLRLIRLLLREVEKMSPGNLPAAITLPDQNPLIVMHHLRLLRDAGLVQGTAYRSGSGPEVTVLIEGLTWSGHDALALMEDPAAWAEADRLLDTQGRGDFPSLLQELRRARQPAPGQ
jgi:hypothetical protein